MDKNKYLGELVDSGRAQFGLVDFDDQSEPQRVFSAIWDLEGEVNNGGFDLFFHAVDSDVIAAAPAALRAIGAEACARIVERAVQAVAPIPAARDDRRAMVDALSDDVRKTLNGLDTEFFAYPDNLTELLFEYVSAHPEAFGPVKADKR